MSTSDMGIDGPTFVPKSGFFFTNLNEGLSKKMAFSEFFSQFYKLAFWQNVSSFKQEILLCPCF